MAEVKKEYLNIWEQVEKNKNDIISLVRGAKTLADFGIKVIGYVSDPDELPDPDEYLQGGGEYGDAFAIAATEEPPYEYYVFTRAFEGEESPQWFNIGEFPKAGPQGEPGQDGEQGERGERGLTGPRGPIGPIGNTGPIGPAGPAPTIGENGNWYRDGVDTGLPSRGPQGIQGEPGSFFHIRGQVNSEDLLPDASEVDVESAYLVGTEAPYDVYAIMDVEDVHYWINLGPVAVVESDTKVGSLTFSATGTLSAEVLNAIANTERLDCLKIGDRYFVKQSVGNYYAMKRDSGEVLVYCMAIDMSTGEWVITTETMVDKDSTQTITGEKVFRDLKLSSSYMYDTTKWKISGGGQGTTISSYRDKGLYIQESYISPAGSAVDSDIGISTSKWRDLYLSGGFNTNSSGYKVTLPDTTPFTANKEIATTDQTFNVINASDISSNTLTAEQKALFINGKPTLVVGTFLTFEHIVFKPPGNINFGEYDGICIIGDQLAPQIRSYRIVDSSNVIEILSQTDKRIRFGNVAQINGKTVPNFPTTNTSPQVLSIAANGGSLSWETRYTEWYGTQTEYDNLGTYDSNTIYNILES